MAYKQNPGRGNQSKTGYGIPVQFKQGSAKKMSPAKQTMGAVGAGAGTETGKYISKKVKEAGNKISKANEAGKKSYDKSLKGDTFWGGSGVKRSYSKNPVEYVKGFASEIMSDSNPKTKEKKKSPVKQMETINKVVSKVKEVGSKVGSAISSANEAGKKSYDKSLKGDTFWGGSGVKRSYSKNPVEYVKGFVSDLASDNNTKTKEKKKSPAKQLGRQAVTKMGGKKAPAKMKKC